MKRILCHACGRSLGNMEIALNLKLRGRSASRFFCLACLSRRLDCTEQSLRGMAEFYRENGCELFSQSYVSEEGSEDA